MAEHHVMHVKPAVLHLSPTLFILHARDHLATFDAQRAGYRSNALLPYYLCCRAMELALKSLHLERIFDPKDFRPLPLRRPKSAKQLPESPASYRVRKDFEHRLAEAYEALEPAHRVLSAYEYELLKLTSEYYVAKRFEYGTVIDALELDRDFPRLDDVAELARKIVAHCERAILKGAT